MAVYDGKGNNKNSTVIRDAFFECPGEVKLISGLMENQEMYSYRKYLCEKFSVKQLNQMALTINTMIEGGCFKTKEEIELAEKLMALILSVIPDDMKFNTLKLEASDQKFIKDSINELVTDIKVKFLEKPKKQEPFIEM